MLNEIYKQIDACKNCDLYKLKYNTLSGDNKAFGKLLTNHKIKNSKSKRLLLIGLSPSYRRFDPERRAFEGVDPSDSLKDIKTSGDFFWYVLKKTKLVKYDIFITNILKCSTEGNEFPLDTQINSCRKLLELEINTLKPDFVISMGNSVKKALLRFKLKNKTFYIMHPSYFFRFKSERSVNLAIEDLNKLVEKIEKDKNTLSGW